MGEKERLARVNVAPPQQAAAQGEEVGRAGQGRAVRGAEGSAAVLVPVGAPRG